MITIVTQSCTDQSPIHHLRARRMPSPEWKSSYTDIPRRNYILHRFTKLQSVAETVVLLMSLRQLVIES